MTRDTLEVLAVCGSQRAGSYNQKLLDISIKLLEDIDVKVSSLDISSVVLPVFSTDVFLEKKNLDLIKSIRSKISSSSGLLVCSPQLNGSIPPFLKNLIDWISVPTQSAENGTVFNDKVVCLLGAARGHSSCLGGLAHLSTVFGYLGGIVVPQYLGISHAERAISESGDILDAKIAAGLKNYLNSFSSLLNKF
jgi:chromate reductase